jgi:hypothetical protein
MAVEPTTRRVTTKAARRGFVRSKKRAVLNEEHGSIYFAQAYIKHRRRRPENYEN